MSQFNKYSNFDPIAKVGMRIRMGDTDAFNPKGLEEKNPIKPDMEGTIKKIDSIGTLHVLWDPDEKGSQRYFGVIPNIDDYVLLPSLEDQIGFDVFESSNVGSKIDSSFKPVIKTFKKAEISKSKLKTFESEEEDLDETMTAGGGGGLAGASGYSYNQPLGTTKKQQKESKIIKVKDLIKETNTSAISATIDFVAANLLGWGTKKDISPPWPSPKRKAENGELEDWWWQTIPTYNGGVITDPYAKTDETWDDEILTVNLDNDITQFQKDVYKNLKKYKQSVITIDKGFNLNIDPPNEDWKTSLQKGITIKDGSIKKDDVTFNKKKSGKTLKKEEISKFVDDLLSESKKEVKVHTKKWERCVKAVKAKNKENNTDYNPYAVCQSSVGYEDSIKKSYRRQDIDEDEVNETTTFASVFPSGNFPVGASFLAKKGKHGPSKNPLWKGGKIIQKIDSHGIFGESEKKKNIFTEINKVKWTKNAKYVKIKDRCSKYNNQPWCSQGAIDNPLELSDKTFESISNLSHKLGLSEDFIIDKINEIINKK